MEERSRSGGYSDRVVKNKNSSGCLIIKKKPNGSDAVGSSASQKMYELKKDKKRPPAVIGDSSSSDDELLEVYRRRGVSRGNRVAGGSVAYKKGIIEDNEFSRKRKKSEFRQVNFGKNEVREGGRKRSKLDVYEFDEYDDLTDVEMRGKGQFGGREVDRSGRRFLGVKPATDAGSRREFETGSTRHNVIPRGESSFLGSSSSEKIGIDGSLVNERFESKTKVPITMLKERFGSPDEAIRLQGKNGVLKLMVNHKNKVNGPLEPQNCKEVGGNSAVSLSKEMTQKNIILHHSSFAKKPNTFDKVEKEKSRSQKLLPVKSRDSSEESSEGSDVPSNNVKVRRSIKRGRSEVGRTPPERLQPARLKEAKVKRGSGTEKQLLREKIRSMLVSAGWTIDYRPRRNRDYCDAVYINPTGTAYWSIIKAYDALQKQLDDVGADTVNDYSPFAPISEEVLSKLTRQTQRKIEKELKRKKKDNVKGKRKREAAAGMLVSCEDDTESSDSGRFEEKLSSFIKQNGKSMKSRSHEAHYGDAGNSTSKERERFPLHGRKSKKIGRCTLLVRNSEKGLNSEDDGFVPYKGKRTVLSWLIDSGTVKLSEKVHYMNRRRSRIMLEGWITRDGIHCGCCSKILTVSKFEIHAASKLRQMFQNIYLSSGISLLQCQLDAWDRQDESLRRGFHMIDTDGDDPDDDTCGICGDGGDLICCDGCPSTFHQNCLDIEMLPPGDWRCPHCSCKICCQVEVSTAEGNGTILDALLTCYLCERKYHNSCMKGKYGASVSSSTSSLSFCGVKCQEIFEQLQKLLGVKHELEAGLSWSLIHRTDVDSDTSLQGLSHRVEWNSKLAVALTVMDECFLPIIDRRSGINLIHNVVYNCGSNFNRLNYSGFYTAILERGDEIISAASIRIHGPELAEMPYIGTRHIYRRQGMFRRLFSAVESALRSLKVEKLIIPAISELMHTWTTVFRFSAVEESQKQEMKSINMLVFPGTDILQKNLVEQETLKLTGKGTVSPEVDVIVPDSTDKSDLDASPGDGAAVERDLLNDLINRQSTGDSSLHGHGASLNESSALGASLDASNEAKPQIPLEGSQVPDSTDKSDLDASPGDGAAVERDLLNDLINHQSTADSSLHGHGASLNESSSLGASLDASNEAKPQIPLEGSQGNPSSISELEDKSEFVRYVNIQYISEASIEVPELGKPSVDSPPKHDIEVSTDCKEDPATVTQEEKVAYADSGSEPGCLSLNSTSFRNTPLHVSDATKQPSEGTTHSTSGLVDELVSEVKDSFALNASHGALVEKPVLDPPIGGNIEQPLLECEGDDAHEVGEKKVADSGSVSTAQDLFVNDASDVKYCLKTYCGTKLEVSNQETVCSHSLTQEKPAASPADLNHGTPPNESHQVVELDRPQPDSCVEIGVRWPSAESGVDPAEEVNFGVDSSGPVCDSFDAHSAENFEMHIANE